MTTRIRVIVGATCAVSLVLSACSTDAPIASGQQAVAPAAPPPPPGPRSARAAAGEPRLETSQLRILPDGVLDFSAGSTISAAGVTIAWEADFDGSQLSAYRLANTLDVDDLAAGDRVSLPIRGLSVTGSPGDWRDGSGTKVVGNEASAFRTVEVSSVRRVGDRVIVAVARPMKMKDGTEQNAIEYRVADGFLVHP